MSYTKNSNINREQKLEELSNSLKSIYENVNFGVILFSDKEKINVIWANQKFRKRFDFNVINESLIEKDIISKKVLNEFEKVDLFKKKEIVERKIIIHSNWDKKSYNASIIKLVEPLLKDTYLLLIDYDGVSDFTLLEPLVYNEVFSINWQIIEKSVDPIIITNLDLEILYSNNHAFKMGIKFDPYNEKRSLKTLFEKDLNNLKKAIKKIVKDKKAPTIELSYFYRKDRIYSASFSPIKNPEGDLKYVLITLRDITKIKEMEEILTSWNKKLKEEVETNTTQLKRAYEELKQLDNLKSDFVNIAGHELRTPLTSIMGYGEILMSTATKLDDEQKKFLKIIIDEAKHTNEIIRDMLDINKIESGRFDMKKRTILIEDLVKNIEDVFKIDFVKNKIKFMKILRIKENAKLRCDESKILQVLKNLISNALKFTNKNGVITLKVVEFDEEYTFSIRDNGVGIPKEEQERIFEKFYQVGSHLRRNQSGTGLGLSIAREIINKHEGKIKVNSQENKGTEFIFNIPKKIKENNF